MEMADATQRLITLLRKAPHAWTRSTMKGTCACSTSLKPLSSVPSQYFYSTRKIKMHLRMKKKKRPEARETAQQPTADGSQHPVWTLRL